MLDFNHYLLIYNEFGMNEGFNFIKGNVKKLDSKNTSKVPHMGWNNCEISSFDNLFKNLDNNLDFISVILMKF